MNILRRVERVDDHLSIDGPGDLDAAVKQISRNRRNPPVALPDAPGLFQKIGQPAGVEPGLDLRPPGQKLSPPAVESAVQLGY